MKAILPLRSAASIRQNGSMRKVPAIILAAGRGRRLGNFTDVRPKCLLRVGGRTLIDHQLEALRGCGIEEAVVVVGYNAEAVRAHLGDSVRYVVNQRHADTNSLYSLWLARDYAKNGFVLLNADVLFDPEVLRRLLHSSHRDALAVERRDHFDEEEMKVALKGDRVVAMSKTLAPEQAHAENLGVVKFSAAGARVLFAKMEELLANGGENHFAPYAFSAIAAGHPLHAVPVDGLPWTEIDFIEDLLYARNHVWPAILARNSKVAHPRSALGAGAVAANPTSVLGD